MSEDDSTPSTPTEPLEQAAQGATAVAGAAAQAEDAPAAAEQAARQAASAGVGMASAAVASEIPEEAQAATAAATAAAQAAATDPSSAATAAVGAGAQAGVGQAAEAAGIPAPLASAATTMAQGAIGQALAAEESPAGAAGAAANAGGSSEGASSSPSGGGSDASHYAGFQAPDAASSSAAAEVLGEDQGQVDASFECVELDLFFDVLDVKWTDRLGAPYEVRVRVSTDEIDAELGRMLGADCSVTLRRNDQEQRLVGICSEVLEGASSEHSAQAMLCIVPAFRLLELRRDSRIFQDKTVVKIIEEVLTDSLGAFGRTFSAEYDRTYPTCEYRVQYDETDFDFVQRLIEEEGLIYWFDHEGDTEVMVLIDEPERHPAIERPEGDTVEMLGFESGQGNLEVIREFHLRAQMKPTRLALRNWSWSQPGIVEGETDEDAPPPEELPNGALSGAVREEYEHDDRPLTFHEYSDSKFVENDLADQLRLRRESQSRDARVGQGKGTVVALRPGHRFQLSGHRAIELDGGYLVTQVVHTFSVDGAERYFNTFDCLPEGVPFRPTRERRKPRIAGMQTAVVVGPADSEIHTDEHGRIRVQFHWDRIGTLNEHSSCYIRVMQAWAGPGWGFVFLPRIGMEVVVSFMGGDPDRPVVTGSLYNGTNTPPFLPDEYTKSTIKTSSSPGGDGYNELTFEDAAGDEQIIVHAQKDYNETVENDHSTTVHGSQTQSVDGTQSETIGGDQTLTAKKNRMVTVSGSQNVTINGEEESGGITGASLGITGDYTVDASKTIAVQAPDMISLTCGDSKIEMVPGRITLETAGSKFEITADIIATAKNGAYAQLKDFAKMASVQGSEVYLDANGLYKSSQGSKVVLNAAVEATSVPGSKVKLDDKALVSGVAEASLEGPIAKVTGQAEATMSAAQAKVAGQAMASVQGGSGTVSCDPVGVTLQGPIVKAN